MLDEQRTIKLLRVIAALAIIVYFYDIIICTMQMVNIDSTLADSRALYDSLGIEFDAVSVGVGIYISDGIALLLSILEVRGGIGGLKGHASKADARLCCIVGIYCILMLLMVLSVNIDQTEYVVECVISGVIAFALWAFNRRVLKMHAGQAQDSLPKPSAETTVEERGRIARVLHPITTEKDYRDGLEIIGSMLMIFSVISLVQEVISLFYPPAAGFDEETMNLMFAQNAGAVFYATVIASIVLSLFQLYLGNLGRKVQVPRWGAIVCLVFGLIIGASMLSNIVTSASVSLEYFAELSCALIALLYWWFCRRLSRMGNGSTSQA